jgi:hypothetical protein
MHQLTIEVTDEVYQPLVERASQSGCSPESLALELIADGVKRPRRGETLRKWMGAVESDVPDAAERHDHYIGEALYNELKRGNG